MQLRQTGGSGAPGLVALHRSSGHCTGALAEVVQLQKVVQTGKWGMAPHLQVRVHDRVTRELRAVGVQCRLEALQRAIRIRLRDGRHAVHLLACEAGEFCQVQE